MKSSGKHRKTAIALLIPFMMTGLLTSCSSGESSYAPSISQTSEEVEIPQESEDSVCYISSSKHDNAFYDTVEEGLSNASSGDVVYVIPGTLTSIYNDCSIKEGVTLCLPYQGTTYTNGDDYTDNDLRGFSDAFIDSIDYFRKTLLIINENVTLTIEDKGSLIVGGYTGFYGGGVAGSTSREYSEILMLSDSKIIAEGSASLYSYGYIRETTYIKDEEGNWDLYGSIDNGSKVEMSSTSTLLLPLVFYDYKSGLNTLKMTKHDTKISPMELFDFPNMQCELLVQSDGENTTNFLGEHKLVASDTAFTDTSKIVGYEDSLLDLTRGTLTMKYTPRLEGFTQRVNGFSTYEEMEAAEKCDGTTDDTIYSERRTSSGCTYEDDEDSAYTVFTLNGDASLNKVEIGLKVSFISLNVDSSEFDFPISYRIRFVIGDGEEETSFIVNNKVKILQGCQITVNKKATVSIKDSLIMYPSYDSYEYSYWNKKGDNDYCYPTGFEDPCVLNNGTVVLDGNASFGGMLHTSEEGAVFDATQGSLTTTSTYGQTYGYEHNWSTLFTDYTDTDTITQSAKGYINGYGDDYLADFDANTQYVSVSDSIGTYWMAK